MADIDGAAAGRATGGQTEDFTARPLYTGDYPVHTTPETVAAATALPRYSVVRRDGAGKLILARQADNAAIGITVDAVVVTKADKKIGVFRSGTFNPDALHWDSSYNNDQKKIQAFETKQPTIFIQKPV